MYTGTIFLPEALKVIESGEFFTIEFVTANRSKGIGGELRKMDRCIKANYKNIADNLLKRNGIAKTEKLANHGEHKTRNIFQPHTGRIIKIHIRLITALNNKKLIA